MDDIQTQQPPQEEQAPEQVAAPEPVAGSPSAFLRNIVGKRVVVRIGSGIDYHGDLTCLDGFMNVALENTEEVVNGKTVARYGDAFLRGNNVVYISALDEE